MENDKKLNLDIGELISAFRYFLKSFEVRSKIYKVFFRGKSFEFDGFRNYTSEDDVLAIDWKASNRAGRLLSRQYREEEDKKIIFVMDVGENMVFGSSPKLKCECAASLVLALTDIVVNSSNDRAGLLLFNDGVKEFHIPKRGTGQFSMFLEILSNPSTYGGGSDISRAIDFILQRLDNSNYTIVLVSDFIRFDKKTKHSIDLLANRYETIAFMVKDPLDKTLPDIKGEFIVENPFSGEQLLLEPRIAKRSYENHSRKQENFVKQVFKDNGIDLLEVSTDRPFVTDVVGFIKGRVKARNGVIAV